MSAESEITNAAVISLLRNIGRCPFLVLDIFDGLLLIDTSDPVDMGLTFLVLLEI